MMNQVIESHLKHVLKQHGLKAADLLRAVQSRYGDRAIKQPTLYKVVDGSNGMPDAKTVEQVMHALVDLTGKTFSLGEVFSWRPDSAGGEA